MRGRPPKPTKVLELTGAFKKHPERKAAREGEPEVTEPLGDPPAHLDESERARWHEIATWCPWLTVADRYVVERVCRLMMLDRKGTATTGQSAQLDQLLARLGMTPTDRTRVRVPGTKPKANPFERLA